MSGSGEPLAKGSEFPPLKKDTLRLYDVKQSPYAHRTRLVLAHKNVPYETVAINLQDKPEWFLHRNPLGMVPVLEINDKMVYESTIINDYLDEVYPENKLTPADPYMKARHRMLMEIANKWIATWYKLQNLETREAARKDISGYADMLEQALTGRFFGGDVPSMVDLHLWPWFELMPAMRKMASLPDPPKDYLPKLQQWTRDMANTPAVKATAIDIDSYIAFFNVLVSGDPDFEPGL